MASRRKYQFSWKLLGDIKKGRPNLGQSASLMIYRLMQFSLRDVLEQGLGKEETDRVFYRAGYLAGTEFYRNLLGGITDYNEFIKRLQELLKELGIGIMRVEKADLEEGEFIITVSEDLDCSGLPELDIEICHFDEGFIAALMESFTGRKFLVHEVDCWCTGDRTCRFAARAVAETPQHA